MSFQPHPNQDLTIDGSVYKVAEHPAAPGIPYGQEGRAATVYQLVAGSGSENRALKVFKPRFQVPLLVSLSKRLGKFADLQGLQVCNRSILTPQRNGELLAEHPDLIYSMLMSWIEGPTWMEVVLDKRPLSREQCLHLARTLAHNLSIMEQEGLAHCDLSAPNVLLPALASTERDWVVSQDLTDHALPVTQRSSVELVDVEGMYGPELRRPDIVSSGSPGYAHRSAREGLWSPEADRFAGAVLLGEMLGWCDPRVRDAAWGESYFEPVEMQQDRDRYRTLLIVLQEHWGADLTRLFSRAWESDTLDDCPTAGAWLVQLSKVSVATTQHEPVQPQEVAAPLLAFAPSTVAAIPDEAEATIASAASAIPDRHNFDDLFDSGLEAYKRGDWAQSREMFGELVRRRPDYARGSQQAAKLLAEANRRLSSVPTRNRNGWVWLVPALVAIVLLASGGVAIYQVQATATAAASASATAVAQAQVQVWLEATATAETLAQAQGTRSAVASERDVATAVAGATETSFISTMSRMTVEAEATIQVQETIQAQNTVIALLWVGETATVDAANRSDQATKEAEFELATAEAEAANSKATSSAAAISATSTARAAGTLLFGPSSGYLLNAPLAGVSTYYLNTLVEVRNFAVEVRLVNPEGFAEDNGRHRISFAPGGDISDANYRIASVKLNIDCARCLSFNVFTPHAARGNNVNLSGFVDVTDNATNVVRVEVRGESATVFLNGKQAGVINWWPTEMGTVNSVEITSDYDIVRDDREVRYENFTVWSLD